MSSLSPSSALRLVAWTASGAFFVIRARVLEGLVQQRFLGHDGVEQTHLEGALRVDLIGAQQELHGLGERDLARQPHRGAAAREQAPRGFEHAEGGVLRGDADVDAAEHLHAARHARSVDRGDDRLVDLGAAQHRVGAVGERVALHRGGRARLEFLGQRGDLRDVGLQVGARHEGSTDAGEDRHPGRVIGFEPLPRLRELVEVLEVARVLGLWAIQGDEHDVLRVGARPELVVDRHEFLSYRTCWRSVWPVAGYASIRPCATNSSRNPSRSASVMGT